jgi:hypothetical protein
MMLVYAEPERNLGYREQCMRIEDRKVKELI